MKKVIAIVCIFIFCRDYLSAQHVIADTVNKLNEVTITSNRVDHFNVGSKNEHIDSITLSAFKHQSLSDLLSSQNQFFIKSYGPGSLATSSFRGAGAEHTAVMWNGFNIQSAMNGQIDFSLLQSDFIDDLNVQYGSSGALFGTGAVGGTIHLINKPNYAAGFHASINFQGGSFENYKEGISVNYGGKRFYSSIRVFNQTAKNDFPFTNTYLLGSPTVNQTNASYAQQGVMTDNYFLIASKQQIKISVWYQNALRQIPPPMSVIQTKATQNDETFRASSEWNLNIKDVVYFIRSAWFNERFVYQDSVSGLLSKSNANTHISEVEVKINLTKNQLLNIGLNNTFTFASSDNYTGDFSQNRTSIFASYKISNLAKTFSTNVNVREENVAGNFLPVMPSAGFEWYLIRSVKLFGNISSSYRIPTFNDLYWYDGFARGNKNLIAENALAEEISLNTVQQLSNLNINFTLTGFNRKMDNYIQWISVNNFYTPQNVKQVWSRGCEANIKLYLPIGKWKLTYSASVNFVLSTNEKSDVANDATLHKQLIYIPKLNYMNQITASSKMFYVTLSQTYTGNRFTASDESSAMKYYLLENVLIGKEFKIKETYLSVNVQAKNLLNETYQVVQNLPMPGRNYLIGITIKI